MNIYVDKLIKSGIKYAVFDIDNTITKSNVLDLYLHIKHKEIGNKAFYRIWLALFLVSHAPVYLLLDFFSREWFQRVFYRKYRKYSVAQLESAAKSLFETKLKDRFIKETHDLLLFFKEHNIEVSLLSTSIEPLVKQYGNYFGVSYDCLKVTDHKGNALVDLTQLKDFKLNCIKKYEPMLTVSIADSKHDLSVLKYTDYSIVVAHRKSKWVEQLNNPLIIDV